MKYKATVEINFCAPEGKGKACIEKEIDDILILISNLGSLYQRQPVGFSYRSVALKRVRKEKRDED